MIKSQSRVRKSWKSWQVITIACIIVMGLGFLLARFVCELGIVESIVAAPLCVVALLIALLTLRWRSH
jgi:hypothetical protein